MTLSKFSCLVLGIFVILLFVPFGGQIRAVIPPNPLCPFTVLNISFPTPGMYAIAPGTVFYPYRMIRPKAWVLGSFIPTLSCPTAVPIKLFGTSL